MCQRPKRALFISTSKKNKKNLKKKGCVNALNGLFSFLPEPTQQPETVQSVCQRPKRALFISTFTSIKVYPPLTDTCVNALNGLFSFLQNTIMHEILHTCVCQRPKRALFISTVPSETSHKYWLSRLIFAGICLKILIKGSFYSFSGMFIFCSYFRAGFSFSALIIISCFPLISNCFPLVFVV